MQPNTPAAKPAVQQKSALDRPAASHQELKNLLARPDVIEQIKLTIPKHMSPERLTKILLSATLKTPQLMKVNQLSLLQVLGQLSELGLEPGSAMGHVYIIPFENRKAGRTDVNVIIGYRGYIELARRSGHVEQIETHVVFEDDDFELVYGLDDVRKLRHIPNWKGKRDPAKALLVYCIARLKGGASHVEVMSMEEVKEIRNASQAWKFKPNSGPWQDNFLEMARKTVIRRAVKYLPMSAEQRDAVELEDAPDAGDAARNIVDMAVRKPDLNAPPPGEDIASQMAAREEPEDAEVVNPETGEVTLAQEQVLEKVDAVLLVEPEAGTVDHLLWRITKATAEQLPELTQEAGKLDKGEPRRGEVGAAISARRKAVTP